MSNNKFKAWIAKSHDTLIQEELDEVKEDVHELDEKLDTYEDVEGNPKEKSGEGEKVEKPGASIHSAKWDRCVQHVKDTNPNANAYAVCTAQLGEEAFKSQFKGLAYTKAQIKKAKNEVAKMDISFAGDVPQSLLAEQDIEDNDQGVPTVSLDGYNRATRRPVTKSFKDHWTVMRKNAGEQEEFDAD